MRHEALFAPPHAASERGANSGYLAAFSLLGAIREMANPTQLRPIDTQAAVSPQTKALLRLLARTYVQKCLAEQRRPKANVTA